MNCSFVKVVRITPALLVVLYPANNIYTGPIFSYLKQANHIEDHPAQNTHPQLDPYFSDWAPTVSSDESSSDSEHEPHKEDVFAKDHAEQFMILLNKKPANQYQKLLSVGISLKSILDRTPGLRRTIIGAMIEHSPELCNQVLQITPTEQSSLIYFWSLICKNSRGKDYSPCLDHILKNLSNLNHCSYSHPKVTPLMNAAMNNYTYGIQLLCEKNKQYQRSLPPKKYRKKKTKINTKDRDGNTALHHAIISSAQKNSTPAAAQILLANKAFVNIKNNVGQTPLHLAVNHPQPLQLVQCLLNHNASVNIQNNTGNTPLTLLAHNPAINSDSNLYKTVQLLTNTKKSKYQYPKL